MNPGHILCNIKKTASHLFLILPACLSCNIAVAQNTVSGTVYNDLDGSAKGSFAHIQTGAETGTNGNGSLHVYVADLSDIIVATATVAADGTYTSSAYDAGGTGTVYLVLDTLDRLAGDDISDFYTIKMPAAWANTSPYMTDNIATGGDDLTNQNFGIQKNGFLTVPDFSLCANSDSLFTWYFRGAATDLVNGTAVTENSGTSIKLPFFRVAVKYFTNNVSYSTAPNIYSPSAYSIAGEGGLQPIPSALGYQNPVLEVGGASAVNGVNNDSVGIGLAFKNTNGQRLHIQQLNNAALDLDTYESLKVIGYNNGAEVKPVIYLSNGYADNTTNDMRSFYTGNQAWMFGVSSSFQSADPCSGWCDYNYNSVAIMAFPTPVDSIFYTARITEPTGNRGYDPGNVGSNEITGFNYCGVSIQGNVWNDANGNGIVDGSEAVILNSGYYINLTDEYGMVLATTQIEPGGSYTFSNFPQLATASAMKLQLSATQGSVGSLPPASSLSLGYVSVSQNHAGGSPETGAAANMGISLPALLNSNLASYNFGIENLPDSYPETQTIAYPPGGTIAAGTVTTAVSGIDAEDGSLGNSNTIVITGLPANAVMYYQGVAVVPGQAITGFNPANLSYSGITNGSTSVFFNYAFIDAAGTQDPSPAAYTVSWLTVLSVNLESFTAVAKDCSSVSLNWKISNAVTFNRFEVEKSYAGGPFQASAAIPYNAASVSYLTSETNLPAGQYQYRLKMVDEDGNNTYSPVASLKLDCGQQRSILVYLNPAKDKVIINGLYAGEQVTMYSGTGQILYKRIATENQLGIDVGHLANGIYYISVIDRNGVKVNESKIARIN